MNGNDFNSNPQTPKTGKQLVTILKSLNHRFFLGLPDEELSSPITRIVGENNKLPINVQCAGHIKILFYQARPKLDRLIVEFEEWAGTRLSQWPRKDQQEAGTILTRPSFIRRDVPPGKSITSEERHELLEYLLKLLSDEYYLLKEKGPGLVDNIPRANYQSNNGRVYDAFDGTTDTSTRRNLFRADNRHGSGNLVQSTTTASSFPETGKRKSAEDQEVFTTAPNSPITTPPIPDEFLDEFEDLDLDDLDLDFIAKADVDVGNQKPKSSKKRQSRIERYMASATVKDKPADIQISKSMISENESTSFSTLGAPTIFSRNQSVLGFSFGSENTDATEPIDLVSEDPFTPSSSMRDILGTEEIETFDAAYERRGIAVSSPKTADDDIVAELVKDGPFARKKTYSSKIPLRYGYELERIASLWNVSVEKILAEDQIPHNSSSHADFWKWVDGHSLRCGNLPEKSSARAWNFAVDQYRDTGSDAVTLSGELDWCHKSEPGYLKLKLKPMKLERSCRFYRRFGSDRFLSITIPYPSKAPKHLRPSEYLQQSIVKWLSTEDHHCLGRVWRAFYLEEVKTKAVKGKERPEMRMKVHLFAVGGIDFVDTSDKCDIAPENQPSEKRTPMSLMSLINWHMPFDANIRQTDCKLFQRFSLGLSKTIPSVPLCRNEILHLKDPPGKDPMNDGCARMSKSLAVHIANSLDLGTTPSVFQGRIAGAKGVWMADRDDTAYNSGDRSFWIQISDSQLKIKPHPVDMRREHVDPDKLTFEVVNWSKPLHSVGVNIQLLTILENRGVPRESLECLIRRQIQSLDGEFVDIVGAGNRLGCRRLMQKLRSSGDNWARKTRRIDGWPMEETEQIIFLLESGFEPLTCSYLLELLRNCLKDFLNRYVERLQIEVPLSTYAYCIADPYGVLEEDEVYLGLSQAWNHDDSAFSDTVFDDLYLLLARLPAHFSSDIQKRKAVWKKELRHYKDVIVFSSKGDTPLAHMLSGGDYDGDMVWICWDPDIVDPFNNAELPGQPLKDEFGLTEHSKPLKDINLKTEDEFLCNSFNFNFKPSLLGKTTLELERLKYDMGIDCEKAIFLSSLASLLVDSRKAGQELTQAAWSKILKKVSPKQRRDPAYMSEDGQNWKRSNIIDYLKFKVAEGEKEEALRNFANVLCERKDDRRDEDLTRLWIQTLDRAEQEKKDGMPDLLRYMRELRSIIRNVHSEWIRKYLTDKTTFGQNVQAAADSIKSIKPPEFDHPLSVTWQNSQYEWDRLRASCLYSHHQTGKFPWYSVGETLCRLKAEANSPTRTLTEDIYLAHQLNIKRSKKIEARASGEGEDEVVDEEEEFYEGEDIFLDADYFLSLEQ